MIYGGSASSPVHKDADIYVSLQGGSTCGLLFNPWDEKPHLEVKFPIVDCAIPENIPRFKSMITWLCNQLQEGKKIHVGCIGGHGRTGLVLAAITSEFLKEKDAIQYVRENYCKKAVESSPQIAFLVKHYGVSKAEPSKAHLERQYDFGDVGTTYHDRNKSTSGFVSASSGFDKKHNVSKNFEEYRQKKQRKLFSDERVAVASTSSPTPAVPAVIVRKTHQPISSTRCIWGKQ
jgi:hypothetical protein